MQSSYGWQLIGTNMKQFFFILSLLPILSEVLGSSNVVTQHSYIISLLALLLYNKQPQKSPWHTTVCIYFLLTNAGWMWCFCYILWELAWLCFISSWLSMMVLLQKSLVLPPGQRTSWTCSSHDNGGNRKTSLPNYASIFQTSICSMITDIPLAKTSCMA